MTKGRVRSNAQWRMEGKATRAAQADLDGQRGVHLHTRVAEPPRSWGSCHSPTIVTDLCPSLQPTNPQESRSDLKNEKKRVDE